MKLGKFSLNREDFDLFVKERHLSTKGKLMRLQFFCTAKSRLRGIARFYPPQRPHHKNYNLRYQAVHFGQYIFTAHSDGLNRLRNRFALKGENWRLLLILISGVKNYFLILPRNFSVYEFTFEITKLLW